MALKDRELDDYYQEIFDVTARKGWKLVLEKVEELISNYNKVSSIKDNEHLHYRKGQLDILHWIQDFRETHEAAYSTLEANDD